MTREEIVQGLETLLRGLDARVNRPEVLREAISLLRSSDPGGSRETKDHSAALLPADPSAAVTTEALPNSLPSGFGYCGVCDHPLDRCSHCDTKDDRDRVYAAVHEEIMKLRVTLHNVLNGRSDIDNIVYHAQNRACAAALAALPKFGSGNPVPPGRHRRGLCRVAGEGVEVKKLSPAANREYRRIRRMVVSMRIHALGKASMARRGRLGGDVAFYEGQQDAMAQLLVAMEPKVKKPKETR